MNSPESVRIHEFSTGINCQGTPNNWVSIGFIANYMNATIEPIPPEVERSIRNKEFAVAEGGHANKPALIGRVVGCGKFAWSVVAIVTRASDEKSRPVTVYRYFLSEGEDGLPKILAWIEDQQKNGQMPVFNPFEQKDIGSPNISSTPALSFPELPPEIQSWLDGESPPLIISQDGQQYTFHQINMLATKKAKTNGQPVAWAFNVEALEQLGGFQMIVAASLQAYNILQKLKANNPRLLAPIRSDEQKIKFAIGQLIQNSPIKIQYLQDIANALENTHITENQWITFFEAEGSKKALEQPIYSPEMVKILTLRAIVIPKFLPNYLIWLDKGNQHKNDLYNIANTFESQITQNFNKNNYIESIIKFKIQEGLHNLLYSLITEKPKVPPTSVIKLLKSDNGIWKKYFPELVKDLEYDLELMPQYANPKANNLPFKLTSHSWQKVRDELLQFWVSNSSKPSVFLKEYLGVAKLFEDLNHAKLSAILYHISSGKVPKKVFCRIEQNAWDTNVFGVQVEREVTPVEQIEKKIEVAIKYLWAQKVGLPITVIFGLVCFGLGKFDFTKLTVLTIHFPKEPNIESTRNLGGTSPPVFTSEMTPKEKELALNNFSQTRQSIQKLVEKIKKDVNNVEDKKFGDYFKEIFQIKNTNDFQYDLVINKSKDKKYKKNIKIWEEKWVEKIYKYQNTNNLNKDPGYILVEDETYQKLEKDIKDIIHKAIKVDSLKN